MPSAVRSCQIAAGLAGAGAGAGAAGVAAIAPAPASAASSASDDAAAIPAPDRYPAATPVSSGEVSTETVLPTGQRQWGFNLVVIEGSFAAARGDDRHRDKPDAGHELDGPRTDLFTSVAEDPSLIIGITPVWQQDDIDA